MWKLLPDQSVTVQALHNVQAFMNTKNPSRRKKFKKIGRLHRGKSVYHKSAVGAHTVRLANLQYHPACDRLVVIKAHIDGALQNLAPLSLRTKLSCLSHYSTLPGNRGEHGIHHITRHQFSWPHIANDVHKTAKECRVSSNDGMKVTNKQ